MKVDILAFSDTEMKVRKQWRLLLFLVPALLYILPIGYCLLILGVNFSPEQYGAMIAEITIKFLLPAYIIYRCAYKKWGTTLLTLFFVVSFLFFLAITTLLFFKLPFPYNLASSSAVLLYGGYFSSLSWRLLKINRKAQSLILTPEPYNTLAEKLLSSSSQEERNQLYSTLVRQWPQFERKSTTLYRSLNSSAKVSVK